MGRASKFHPANGARAEPKRPASAIKSIADVISVAPSTSDDSFDRTPRKKPSKRAKISHKSSSPEEDSLPQFALQPNARSATSMTTARHNHGNNVTTATSAATPDLNPPDAYTVLPPALSTALRASYDVHSLSILTSTKINTRVANILNLLENGFDLSKQDQKPGLVALTAKGQAANKLVSVVEIAKRELEAKKVRWFQYNGVGGWMSEVKEKDPAAGKKSWGKGRALDGTGGEQAAKDVEGDVDMEGTSAEPIAVEDDDDDDDDEGDEAFETMASGEQRKKVRKVPVLTIYMSRVPVAQLKAEYGEQSYDPRKPLVVG